MRKTILITLFVFVIYISTGLETLIGGRMDITGVFYVRTVGLDKVEDDKIQLTIVTSQYSPEEETSNLAKQDKYFVSVGRDVFEASRNYHSFMKEDIFWGHIDFIIISEDLAKNDIDSTLDYFIRGHENKLTANVLVAKGARAEEVIKLVTDAGEDISTKLNVLSTGVGALSVSSQLPLIDAFNKINNEYCSCFIPTVQIVEDEKEEPEEETKEAANESEDGNTDEKTKKLILEGYAFFDQDDASLLCFMGSRASRGFNFIINEVKSGVIVVEDPNGEFVNLEIIDSKTSVMPEFKDGKITVTLKNEMSSNVTEIHGDVDIFKHEIIEDLVKQQNEIVKQEMQSVIDMVKMYNSDLFDLSSIIFHKHPKKWDKIKDSWREELKNITFIIEVDSKINRTYTIKKPALSRD
ncbi:Ger(x)C family spore germination protein [Mycoplasmatota bacterium WC44]